MRLYKKLHRKWTLENVDAVVKSSLYTAIFHTLSALVDQRHEVKIFKLCSKRHGFTYCVQIGYLNGEVALILNVLDYRSFSRKKNPSDLKISLYISSKDG